MRFNLLSVGGDDTTRPRRQGAYLVKRARAFTKQDKKVRPEDLAQSSGPKQSWLLANPLERIVTKILFIYFSGVIYYLRRQTDSKLPPLIERQKSKFFSSELLFLETMILDHLHMYYKDALAKVKLAIEEPK
jgi:hypothetical protein